MSEAFSILSGALDEAINDTKTKKITKKCQKYRNRTCWCLYICSGKKY